MTRDTSGTLAEKGSITLFVHKRKIGIHALKGGSGVVLPPWSSLTPPPLKIRQAICFTTFMGKKSGHRLVFLIAVYKAPTLRFPWRTKVRTEIFRGHINC
jgi:hypothetical protein